MNKTIEIYCPKEEGKRYFSFKDHGYSNSLNVYLNGNLIFEGIDDREEMLPIRLSSEHDINPEQANELKFEYNIKFKNYGEESASVKFIFDDKTCHTIFERNNWVEQSDKLESEYSVNLEVNEHAETFGKEWHEGNTKTLAFEHEVDFTKEVNLRWWSRKSFVGGKLVTYDDMRVRIWN